MTKRSVKSSTDKQKDLGVKNLGAKQLSSKQNNDLLLSNPVTSLAGSPSNSFTKIGLPASAGRNHAAHIDTKRHNKTLYTPDQKHRRDTSIWTPVQGVLAALQFMVFAISLILVLYFMATGQGQIFAESSILVKTGFLYTIMITGAIWEKVVFGQYLFAPAFFWEDIFSFAVIASHTAYLVMLFGHYGSASEQMILILIGYGLYVINAGQFIIKLRKARAQASHQIQTGPADMPLCHSDISPHSKTAEGHA